MAKVMLIGAGGKDTPCSSQALPLNVTATPQTSELQSPELSP